jgi:hypothetical protein
VSEGFYLEACLQVKEHRHDIKGKASTRAKGFSGFSLKNAFCEFLRILRDNKSILNCGVAASILKSPAGALSKNKPM